MRKTVVLFAIMVALAAYVYFYEIKGGEEREKEKEVAEKLVNIKKDSVQTITLESWRGKYKFQRTTDGWMILHPVATMADDSPINSLLSSLESTKKTRSFSVEPGDRDQYGLGNRALKISINNKNGMQDSVLLGDKTNIGSNVYASRLDTMVHLVSNSLKSAADKSLFDWRDKKTVHFEKSEVREFDLESPQGDFKFVKTGSDWQIKEPIETRAENATVDAVLNKLDFGNIKTVVEETAVNKKNYKLDKPAYVVDMYLGAEKAKTSVVFSKTEQSVSYGKDAARPHIFTVDSTFMKPFNEDLFAFRYKNIVDFDRNKADKLNLLYNGELMTMAKDSSDNWTFSSGEKAKSWKVSSILSAVTGLKAEQFVEEKPLYYMPYGLVNPEGRIEIFSGDDLLAELNIGKTKGDFVYIRNPRQTQVITIKKSKLDDLFPDEEDIKEEVTETESEENK